MDAPTISTLPPDAEAQPTTSADAQPLHTPDASAQPVAKSRPKVKLRVAEPAPSQPAQSTSGGPARASSVHPRDEEEDELMDDELLGAASGSTKPPPAKKARRAPKAPYPGQSQVSTLLTQSSSPAKAHGDHDTMMSAWQVNMPAAAPIAYAAEYEAGAPKVAGGSSATNAATPVKPPRKRAPAKPKANAGEGGLKAATSASAPRKRATAASKPAPADDSKSMIEDTQTPPPTKSLISLLELPVPDIKEIVDSGQYKLAPSRPLITRPFPVQPALKGGHAYATAPPLDRSGNKPRKWTSNVREIRTISGGSWKAKTWMGDDKSELAAAAPPAPAISVFPPLGLEGSPAPSSTGGGGSLLKHPSVKRAQGQSGQTKPRRSYTKKSKLAQADSAMSSDIPSPRTREPSVDTEMLSLMGDGDLDDALSSVAAPSVGQKTPRKQRMMNDHEMEDFLADD